MDDHCDPLPKAVSFSPDAKALLINTIINHFLKLLEGDFGILHYALENAFMGMPLAPKKQAIELCEWAVRAAVGDAEEAGKALLAWARKNHRGSFGLA
jgi:hypothetical protein